ncbi:MAG: hypothetical protein EBU90_20660 [Proteobacteria bacterium]|nr:hypothetical protein [Pseudomonadota bacterium]NBP15462.1 hypothetical protein [bacterium]
MLDKIKNHFNKSYNLVFWVLFGPAMIWTLYGIQELYTEYYDLLTKEDHLQFFLRFFFPISLGLLVTALERRQRKRREQLAKQIQEYLER